MRPSKIKLSSQANQKMQAKIIVKNPAPQVAMFEVYIDQFDDKIYLNPQSFILESGEKREVLLTAKFPEPGQYLTDISIVASPVSSLTFQAKGGVKIPIEVGVSSKDNLFLASIFSTIKSLGTLLVVMELGLIVLIGLLIYQRLQNR